METKNSNSDVVKGLAKHGTKMTHDESVLSLGEYATYKVEFVTAIAECTWSSGEPPSLLCRV